MNNRIKTFFSPLSCVSGSHYRGGGFKKSHQNLKREYLARLSTRNLSEYEIDSHKDFTDWSSLTTLQHKDSTTDETARETDKTPLSRRQQKLYQSGLSKTPGNPQLVFEFFMAPFGRFSHQSKRQAFPNFPL